MVHIPAVSAEPRTPPGPDGLPLLGSSPQFRRDLLGFFTRCAREHGDVAAFRLGPQSCRVVSDPDLIESVLVDLADRMRKGWDLRQLRFVLGRGLLTNEGDDWYRRRRLIQPAFHHGRIHEYARVMGRRAVERAASWRDGRTLDVHAEMMALTLELPKYAYFPFGGGPRYCIGSGFAMMEATLVLAAVLRRWRFRPLPDHPVVPQPAVTLRPRHGIRMIPNRR